MADIAARVGTPCYVYSRARLEQNWHAFDAAFGDYPHRICYAVKANGNLAVLNLFARLGSGFDIVSGGELRRVLQAGGAARDIIFSGVGKQPVELDAALRAGVGCFNIESAGELARLSAQAAAVGRVATISVRLNPDVDAGTHPYISTGRREDKFGVAAAPAMELYLRARDDANIRVGGVACHIGSQLTALTPYRNALRRALAFIDQLEARGVAVEHLDFGGGLGVKYRHENPPTIAEYADALLAQLQTRATQLPLVIEPGRALVGDAGILLTRVNYLKPGQSVNFCIVDAGMNDLLRPALYQAEHEIVAVAADSAARPARYDVVGPVCESGDFLGRARALKVRVDDLLAVKTAGAYAASMSSNYNARPRPAEVMVDGDKFYVIRRREKLADLYRGETILPQ